MKVKANLGNDYINLKNLLSEKKLNTVCEEASCPNIYECWSMGTATFMIMGDVCTRACGFCESGVVAVANCGEGATATGTWHESINMAGVLNLPVVFTVQNNQFAYSSPNETEFGTPSFCIIWIGWSL